MGLFRSIRSWTSLSWRRAGVLSLFLSLPPFHLSVSPPFLRPLRPFLSRSFSPPTVFLLAVLSGRVYLLIPRSRASHTIVYINPVSPLHSSFFPCPCYRSPSFSLPLPFVARFSRANFRLFTEAVTLFSSVFFYERAINGSWIRLRGLREFGII